MQKLDKVSKQRAIKLFGGLYDFAGKIRKLNISKNNYPEAMIRGRVKTKGLRALLRTALTDKIDDREVYAGGIEQSYYYEEPDNYKG